MSRALSAQAVASLNALSTDSAWFILIEIDHEDLEEPYRFVNNTTDIQALARSWMAFPFDLTLAVDDGNTQPTVEVRFDNVDRTVIDIIRGLASAPSFSLYVVLSTQTDVIEMTLSDLEIIDIIYDVQSISGRLVSGDLLNAPYPADAYEPSQFPGIFF